MNNNQPRNNNNAVNRGNAREPQYPQAPAQGKALAVPEFLNYRKGQLLPTPEQWDFLKKFGQDMVQSGILPSSIKNGASAALIIMKALELDIHPLEAFSELYAFDGKVSMSTIQMRKQVRRKIKGLTWTIESAPEKEDGSVDWVEIKTVKCPEDRAPLTVRFTWKAAVRAGLTNKDNWKKYPRDMLTARAESRYFRLMAPEALSGCNYTADELQDTRTGEPVQEVTEVIETTGRPVDPATEHQNEGPGQQAPQAAAAEAQTPGPSPGQDPSQAPAAAATPVDQERQRVLESMKVYKWNPEQMSHYLQARFKRDRYGELSPEEQSQMLETMASMDYALALKELELMQGQGPELEAPEPAQAAQPSENASVQSPAEANSSLFDQIMNRHGGHVQQSMPQEHSREPGSDDQ